MEEEEKESAYTGENESAPLMAAVAKGRGGHLGVSLAADTPRFASVVRASWDSGSGQMVLSVDSVSSMTAASPSLPPSQSPSPPLNQRSREGQSRSPYSQPLSQPDDVSDDVSDDVKELISRAEPQAAVQPKARGVLLRAESVGKGLDPFNVLSI